MSGNAAADAAGMEPLVSVVVPAWNAEATLAATLRSVAAQTYRNLEIIIVDDGSTDRTAAVAGDFCSADQRARLIRKENGGVAASRNRAISEARGSWIAPIDADDLWHPTKIEKQVAAARAAADEPGFVYCWRRLIDADDRVIVSGSRLQLEGSVFTQLAYLNAVGCGSALLASRQAVLEAGGYDEELRAEQAQGCEDMLLQLKIARKHPIALVPEHLVGWRLHTSNMSSDFEQMARSANLVFRRLAAGHSSVPRRVVRWVAARDCFDIAQSQANEGRYGGMVSRLAAALRLDPVGSGLLLAYRAARSASRRLRRREPPPPPPRFQDVDPATEMGSDPYRLKGFSRLLERLDARRLARLAAGDRTRAAQSIAGNKDRDG